MIDLESKDEVWEREEENKESILQISTNLNPPLQILRMNMDF